ncbi:RagB/SusD family nutrient uptake outer membrane protein [Hufsiella ginkgonis]|uniref:SusD/RagB family nutrient-binding outer membrane lipoprotein n=1 Tax=Hufsiella ginkgonis TaxID=2695274 RepID=A0A7K1XUZ4_9SPHI|nr:RagB/SusD family nutrient uptake outer membrane protein [Hufsiella ginkgonis]MXV14589.1 SusD/RagB family nutrient-binding outer membrane lipoprotein [Hufsiella ginkgonis]
MKKLYILLIASGLVLSSGCKKYLDVNTNPNAPEKVAANLYLAPMLHWMVTAPLYEGRFVGRYTQNWKLVGATVINNWEKMGYDPASDNAAEIWRDVYWSLGQNLVDMTNKAEAEQRWDLLGVAQILKAWGWQSLTDLHGEITIKEAIDPSKTSFSYDSQEFAYQEVQRLLGLAIANLQKTEGNSNTAYLAVGDKIYNGDRTKWIKYAYALLAVNLSHYSNKPTLYKPADVIAAVDKSFASNADDALLTYTNTANDDTNFFGPRRGNLVTSTTSYRQTQFIVNLMNGTAFNNVVDPRMSRMLAPSSDGTYNGTDINVLNFGALAAAKQPYNLHGYAGAVSAGVPTRYIFDDKSKIPAITYSQLQFIKAEAAFRMNDKTTALTAYKNGISSHIDFVNARNSDNGQLPSQISAAEKTAFLSDVNIVPTDPAQLTLTHIMCQKYIALWAWGHMETWMDMRRFHYTDADPATTKSVYVGFALPTTLYDDNGGKPVQRLRPRYNSEYVWNRANLDLIGALAIDYHIKPLWILQP